MWVSKKNDSSKEHITTVHVVYTPQNFNEWNLETHVFPVRICSFPRSVVQVPTVSPSREPATFQIWKWWSHGHQEFLVFEMGGTLSTLWGYFWGVGFPTHKLYPYGFLYRRGFLHFRYQRNVWWFMVFNPGIHHVHGFLHPIHQSMRKWSNSTSTWFQMGWFNHQVATIYKAWISAV